MGLERTDFEQQVVVALIDSGAMDFRKMGRIYGKFAQQAATEGENLVLAINTNLIWNCGWEVLELTQHRLGVSDLRPGAPSL